MAQPGEELTAGGRSYGIVARQYAHLFGQGEGMPLECGQTLGPIDVAYQTYGELNEQRDNAILICHALSGDAHVAGRHHPEDAKLGWWDIMVGPGKPIDTDKYFVICSNCLGGCMGTTGPSSVNPKTGKPYALAFPMITIRDMVDLQRHLLDYLGIEKLLAVIGGSMGGMQVLEWSVRYPDRVEAAIPIATTARLSAQGIAFNAVGRNAILRDENFQQGDYYHSQYPSIGLAMARMVGHITYLSEEAMHQKFGRRLQFANNYQYDFDNEFSVETYLDYQGTRFVDRFDANTYLYFSKAMDYYDLGQTFGSLEKTFERVRSRFLVISFSSDWLFPPRQSRELVDALIHAGKDVAYCQIDCPFGHDAFLLETRTQGGLIQGFLRQTVQKRLERKNPLPPRPVPSAPDDNPPPPARAGSIFTGERVDHRLIEHLIAPGSAVLDLGCGSGDLLERLQREKRIRGLGLTLDEQDVLRCTERGIAVVQYDLHEKLDIFADRSFDYVVLSQALQVIRKPREILREMLRIGRQVIVSFPNFAYWQGRLQLFLAGRAPVWKSLPCPWYQKPEESVNYMSIRDFEEFVRQCLGARLLRRIPLSSRRGGRVRFWPNLLADEAIFVISENPEQGK